MSPYLVLHRPDGGASKIPLVEFSEEDRAGDIVSVNAGIPPVLENGQYEVELFCDQGQFENPRLFVLDDPVGTGNRRVAPKDAAGNDVFVFNPKRKNTRRFQPFLLHHDIVRFAVRDENPPGPAASFWHTDCFQCLCEDGPYAGNLDNMIRTLVDPDFEASIVAQWMIREGVNEKDVQGGLVRGTLRNDRPKNLNSFIRVAQFVLDSYSRQYTFFRTRAQHKVTTGSRLVSYEKVRSISPSDFLWLMHNAEHMHEVDVRTRISHGGKFFMPDKMLARHQVRNYDFAENRIVVSFLAAVVRKAEGILKKLRSLLAEPNGSGLLEISAQGVKFISPLGSVRKWQRSYFNARLEALQGVLKDLKGCLRNYRSILPVSEFGVDYLPPMTKIFQEIQGYRDIFESMRQWFGFGEFAMDGEAVLLGVKKLDSLLEYYGLFTILMTLHRNGFVPNEEGRAIYHFSYQFNRYGAVQNDREVNNTYRLHRDNIEITVYSQCCIYAHWKDRKEWERKANGIPLTCFHLRHPEGSEGAENVENESYWDRTGKLDEQRISRIYVTPDFLLKIHRPGKPDVYVVLDAKFSHRGEIFMRQATAILDKYFVRLIPVDPEATIGAVWILQGRCNQGDKAVKVSGPPMTSLVDFRIIPLDSSGRTMDDLWNGIRRFIPEDG